MLLGLRERLFLRYGSQAQVWSPRKSSVAGGVPAPRGAGTISIKD